MKVLEITKRTKGCGYFKTAGNKGGHGSFSMIMQCLAQFSKRQQLWMRQLVSHKNSFNSGNCKLKLETKLHKESHNHKSEKAIAAAIAVHVEHQS